MDMPGDQSRRVALGKNIDTEPEIELARSTEAEKQSQIERLRRFHEQHRDRSEAALQRIRQAAIDNRNIFEALMDAVRDCSLGQISNALFEVGGQYRRNM